MRIQVTEFKNCNKRTPVYPKVTEDELFIFWINVHTPIEKKSNQDWNTTTHLKNNGPHITFLWSFGFLSWSSPYVFITNCGLNEYAYILEIVLDILDKLIHDSQNICGCLTLNEMHINLISLIICLINDNHQHLHLKERKQYCI